MSPRIAPLDRFSTTISGRWSIAIALLVLLAGCTTGEHGHHGHSHDGGAMLDKYTSFRLESDLGHLSDGQRRMVGTLIEAAEIMDGLFWQQAYGDRDALLSSIDDADLRRFAEINYGPWDRLDADRPFLDGVGPKPPGANFYPADLTEEKLQQALESMPERAEALKDQYTMVRRNDAGELEAIPYSRFFPEPLARAADKLREAAALAEDGGFRRYLELRADALLSDDYRPSDMAWMEMKTNEVDVVIGPIENYEDKLLGAKTAFEAYVLLKDMDWSARLERYASFLPQLQTGLPVPDAYKAERPGSDADLNAYDVVYYAGDCNAGSKTIAINLPNDEQVQLERGSRRLQLKNAMRAKFEKILEPIAGVLIDESQRQHITFDAFFANTMFHEVAHGLGIKNTLDGQGTVREALRDQTSALEEGKADVLGLYMVTKLHDQGELGDAPLEDYYATFLGSTFRSVRFGASSAHGRANMIRFNFFKEMGAFTRGEDGTYRMDMQRMRAAIDALSEKILRLQGDGDYDGAERLVQSSGKVGDTLKADLERLDRQGIPVDVTFEQGADVLGL